MAARLVGARAVSFSSLRTCFRVQCSLLSRSYCTSSSLLALHRVKSVNGPAQPHKDKPFVLSRHLCSSGEHSQDATFEEDDRVNVISDSEKVTSPADKHEFQAETLKLLDIVAKSLYSEREVFIREIISNSSDALEKVRHLELTGAEIADNDLPLEVNITTNEARGTFTLQDFGVGMTKDELIKNLGTIARSGSKDFIEKAAESESSSGAQSNIIGQFGVGFYSTFMVGKKVDVYTKSYLPGSQGYMWTSDGSGTYEVAEAEGVSRGTKVTVHLKDDCQRFSLKTAVEEIIKKYSNFVGFPIFLNGVRINTIQALWTLDPKSISEEEHDEFYRFVSNAQDKPKYHLHFKTDAPLNIRSIFYFPEKIPEMYGIGRMESGLHLYSRKVMITPKAHKVLPEWLRFVKGVVDSEDIPLNLSRELLQDSLLIRKMQEVLVARIVRFLKDQARKDRVKYEKFVAECGIFLREGVVTTENEETREKIAELLRYESSNEKPGTMVSLESYISRMKPTQKNIYYICSPSRELAETSPYFEALKRKDVEVLFTYEENDDIVLHFLRKFQGKPIISAENHLSASDDVQADTTQEQDVERLTDDKAKTLATWLETTLGKSKISTVNVSQRLTSHPAMVTVQDMAAARRWLKIIKSGPQADLNNMKFDILQPTLEINPTHEIILALDKVRTSDPQLAQLVAEQLYDNAMIAAGLLDDPRPMVARLNSLLAKALKEKK